MKSLFKPSLFVKTLKINHLYFSLLLLFPLLSFGQQQYEDKVESPYFIVKGAGPGLVELPLKHTEAHVDITGVIADVTVKQVYTNNGEVPVEAVYVFPGSSKSAVYGMRMIIGERVIEAEVKEKQQAKQEYEKAKQEGKSASLLEQHRPNVFQMNVANIQPGDTISVELNYTELLVPEEGIYEYVYPTVVGPRYADSTGVVKDPWVLNPHTNPDYYLKKHNVTFSKSTFNIYVNLNTGMPIKQAQCTSHEVNTQFRSDSEASFELKYPDTFQGDQDFILRYQLTEDKIETGLCLFEGEEENFFLMMMQPPKRVKTAEILPREYIFIVDVSGSMNGFPITVSKTLMRDLLSNLRSNEKFNVLLFAGGSSVFSNESVYANESNIKSAIRFIDKEGGYGSTQLLPALKRALALPKDDNYSRTVVIATDGYVTVEKEAFDLIREKLGDANFFPFGIGTHPNRYLIEGLARAGQGEPFVATQQSEAIQKANLFRKYIQSPVLTNIKVNFDDFETYDVEPVSFPDLFAERPVVVFGKWKGKPKGAISVSGMSGSGAFKNTLNVKDYDPKESNSALRYLWARHRIMNLSDYNQVSRNEKLVSEITALGLKYNLLTDYTSFIAVDNQATVSKASENSSGSVPEPHEWALIIVTLLTLSWLYLKNSGKV